MFHTEVQGSTGRLKLGQTEVTIGVSSTFFVRAIAAPDTYDGTIITMKTATRRGR